MDDTVLMHLLPMMVERPNLRPTTGLMMPAAWRLELYQEGLDAVDETVTDGNCGIHAFAIGLIDAAGSNKMLATTSQFKKARFLKGNAKELIQHLRCSAAKWMRAHADTQVWGDMSFKDIAVAMAGLPGRTFGEQINVAARDGAWIDCSVLLALACVFAVDVVIHQPGQPPATVGPSLMQIPALARVNIAMINDLHFWGLQHVRSEVPMEAPGPRIVDRPIADADDEEADAASQDDYRRWYQETQEATRQHMADDEVAQELALCKALMSWDPFTPPSQELIVAMQNLRPSESPSRLGLRCLLRHAVVGQLQYEQDHLATLPSRMLNHAAARYRLRTARVIMKGGHNHKQLMAQADVVEHSQVPGTSELADLLAPPCGGKAHVCLDVFRESPQIVRNWRLMWRSSPPEMRREKLIEMMASQLAKHHGGQDQREWQVEYSVMGIPVCRAAFLRVTGIGVSSLTTARRCALEGHASSLSRKTLGMHRLIVGTSHDPLFLDARQWLEHYADTHGEQAPMELLTFLPAGRKQFYWAQYKLMREQQGLEPAALKTFQEAWRLEVSWLTISRSICKFSKCGVCEYLKWLIDKTPRSQPDVMQMYLERLGSHFDFQSAQRLAVARIEEICRQSANTKWLMIIDKMDQNAAKLPTEWPMMRSAFFKEGERLQMSLNGAWFLGPRGSAELLVRTMYEDFKHGSNMQASTLLLNFHNRVMQEGVIPEEWFINADNTAKETKNTITANFAIWLLLNMADTPLWSVTFVYQIVGHTHNKLDRFFALLKMALQGISVSWLFLIHSFLSLFSTSGFVCVYSMLMRIVQFVFPLH